MACVAMSPAPNKRNNLIEWLNRRRACPAAFSPVGAVLSDARRRFPQSIKTAGIRYLSPSLGFPHKQLMVAATRCLGPVVGKIKLVLMYATSCNPAIPCADVRQPDCTGTGVRSFTKTVRASKVTMCNVTRRVGRQSPSASHSSSATCKRESLNAVEFCLKIKKMG